MLPKDIRLFWLAPDHEVPPSILQEITSGAETTLNILNSWDALKDVAEPNAVLMVNSGLHASPAAKKIFAKDSSPAIIAIHGSETGHGARINFKHEGILTSDTSKHCAIKIISDAVEIKRKEKRLRALRDHHRASRSFDGNPALALITEVVKSCTASETYEDILISARVFFPSIMYSDAALFLVDETRAINTMMTINTEKKIPIVEVAPRVPLPERLEIDFDSPATTFVRPDSLLGIQISKIRKQPWGSAMIMGFRGNSSDQLAAMVLFRKDLFPFTEKDAWILELAYHPMSLALDKVRMLERLHRASSKWRSTFDGISEGVTVINGDFEIVKANRAFANLVEHDIKALKGRRCYALLANKRTPCKNCPITTGEGGATVGGRNNRSVHVSSYSLATGNDHYHFQFYRDISREAGLASRLIQAEKISALGKIVSAIAHELNNPLGGILATSQVLLRDSDHKEELEEIINAALRSKSIIDTLLGFTAGSFRNVTSGTVQEAINSTLMLVKSGIGKIKVRGKIKRGESVVENFPALQQVLFNLITNAIHALGNHGSISIATDNSNGMIRISISDSGPGIPLEKQKHIFDPFFTSKTEGTGTGLGLAIVKNLVERMGGNISVASKKNEGTTFTISIPEKALE